MTFSHTFLDVKFQNVTAYNLTELICNLARFTVAVHVFSMTHIMRPTVTPDVSLEFVELIISF